MKTIKTQKAMTLAEVLITVGIIGVIAVMLLPPTIKAVDTWIFSSANTVFLSKLKEGINQMNLNSSLTGYPTNDSFVDEFQKYFKVAKKCGSTNIGDCFVSRFKTDSQTIDVSTALMNGIDLGQVANTSALAGLVLIDGTTMLIAYDPTCNINASIYNTSEDKTSCMAILYDVNGKTPPNKMGADIQTLNASVSSCDIRLGSICVASGDTTPSAIDTCSDTTWDSNLTNNTYCADNYWAGAKKACSNQGMRLPSKDELSTIIYPSRATISGINLGAYYWSATEYNANLAFYKSFSTGDLYGYDKNAALNVRCVR